MVIERTANGYTAMQKQADGSTLYAIASTRIQAIQKVIAQIKFLKELDGARRFHKSLNGGVWK